MSGVRYIWAAVLTMVAADLWQWQFSDAEAATRLPLNKTEVAFEEIPGWADEDHAEAFVTYRRSCKRLLTWKKEVITPEDKAFNDICFIAATLPNDLSSEHAKQFFEANFTPFLVSKPEKGAIVTGYFEPEINGSLTKSDKFSVPVYAKPDDLTLIKGAAKRGNLPKDLTAARLVSDELVPYYTRQEIEEGALDGRGLEIAYLEDPYETFVLQIQGSGLIRLPDGKALRIGFAAKNGHPYTSVGKILIDRGALEAHAASMHSVINWMRTAPQRGRELMWENKSYPFFRVLKQDESDEGPHGAIGVPLTGERSMAVDPRYHKLGSPIWVSAPKLKTSKGNVMNRLMIAQDTGSAIRGPVRGDIFWGSGDAAGKIASTTKHDCDFYVFIPK